MSAWFRVFVKCLLAVNVGGMLLIGCSPNELSSNNNELQDLSVENFSLDQIFQSTLTSYNLSVNYLANSIRIRAIPEDDDATVTVNGVTTADDDTFRIALDEGDNTVDVVVTAANGDQQTYTINANRGTFATFDRTAYVKAYNTEAGDAFGISLAVTNEILVVGAHWEDSNTTGINTLPNDDGNADDSGAVYAYVNYGGTWILDAYLKASNTAEFDYFGSKVALSGNTLAVSAPNEDGIANNSGAVYIFVRSADGFWSQQAYIKASNAAANDNFGDHIDLDGDTLVVGAPNQSSDASNSGAVYVFTRDTAGNWTQQAYLKASNPQANAAFSNVAISGDTLAVGAPGENSDSTGIDSTPNTNGSAVGAVYIFERDGNNTWAQQAYIKPGFSQNNLAFGIVDIDENTLVVGATGDTSESYGVDAGYNPTITGSASGSAFVFVRENGNWSQQAYIKAPQSGTNNTSEYFGLSVAIDGDAMVIGAPGERSSSVGINPATSDDTLTWAGAAYLYHRSSGSWQQTFYLKADAPETDDLFGLSVAIAGDIVVSGIPGEDSNSFGVNDVYLDDGSTIDSGAAYLYQ